MNSATFYETSTSLTPMRLRDYTHFSVLLLFLLCTGCAQKSTVVLVADPDGKVGQITVANDGGSVDLTRHGEAIVAADRQSTPGKSEILSDQQITAMFATVLNALPAQPEHFILYFQKGATELTEESEKEIAKVLQSIQKRNSDKISVVGHSDTAGDRNLNLRLSNDRATAVSKILVRKGVPETSIDTTSHGEENLLIKTPDNVLEPRNRRVEIVVR